MSIQAGFQAELTASHEALAMIAGKWADWNPEYGIRSGQAGNRRCPRKGRPYFQGCLWIRSCYFPLLWHPFTTLHIYFPISGFI